MGRPINKKYFANLNAPYDDAQTGGPTGGPGEGVASVTVTDPGNNYTTLSAVTIGNPTLLGGTTATATVTNLKAVSATIQTSGSGGSTVTYNPGDILTVLGGTGTSSTFTIATVNVRTLGVVNTGSNYQAGNKVTFSGTGWSAAFTATIDTVNANGSIETVSFSTGDGVYAGAALTNPLAPTSTNGTGTNATFNLGLGVRTVTVLSGGVYTAVASNPRPTVVSAGLGDGATLNVAYGVNSVSVLTAGAGYDTAPSVTFADGNAAATSALTSSAENGIVAYARIEGSTSTSVADIMKQEASRRYLVRNADGQSQCILVTTSTLSVNEMYILAFDSLGSSYYVDKLTSRRARLNQQTDGGSGFEYTNGAVTRWSFDAATTGTVQIDNA